MRLRCRITRVRTWIDGGRLDVTAVTLFIRGALLLCSPALYRSGGLAEGPARLGILLAALLWILILGLAHERQHDIASPRWLRADVGVQAGYLIVIASLDQGVARRPRGAGPGRDRVRRGLRRRPTDRPRGRLDLHDDRPRRRLGPRKRSAPAFLGAVGIAVVAAVVIPAIGPPWARRLADRLAAAQSRATRPSTELLSRVAAEAEQADLLLARDLEVLAANPIPAREALQEIAQNRTRRAETVREIFRRLARRWREGSASCVPPVVP